MNQNQQSEDPEFAEDYRHIKSDVRKVIITNLLIILLLVGVYFLNRQTGFLNKLTTYF